MKKLILLLTLAHILLLPAFSYATIFPVSSEMQIAKIGHLIASAPKGLYITVGGERAFRGASMFAEIENLIIVDISPEIIKFNQINIELLRANTKETYKHLRWDATFVDWQKISNNLSTEDYSWWVKNIRNIKGYTLPEELNKHGSSIYNIKYLTLHKKLMAIYPELAKKFNNIERKFLQNIQWEEIASLKQTSLSALDKSEFAWFEQERSINESCVNLLIKDPTMALDLGQVIDYRAGNYLFSDKLYARLHDLVLQNKIILIQADLANAKELELLIARIKSLQTQLAVLDLDNLYAYDYMGEEKFRFALTKLIELGSKDAILILMNNYKDFACAQFSIYVGFTFENVRSWPKEVFFDKFICNLPMDLYPLLDGRLYMGQDKLPIN